jgi:tetratricopeptide (TPR) repeat protein
MKDHSETISPRTAEKSLIMDFPLQHNCPCPSEQYNNNDHDINCLVIEKIALNKSHMLNTSTASACSVKTAYSGEVISANATNNNIMLQKQQKQSCSTASQHHHHRQQHGFQLNLSSMKALQLQQQETAVREQATLMNKIGCACLSQQQQQTKTVEEAKRSFASGLVELRRLAPLVCERYASAPGNEEAAQQLKLLLKTEGTMTTGTGTGLLQEELATTAKPNKHLYIFQRESYDEGMHVYKEPMSFLQPTATRAAMEVTLLYNLGQAYVKCSQHRQAKGWFQLALQVAVAEPRYPQHQSHLYFLYHQLGNIVYRFGDNDAALEYYQRALAIANNNNNCAATSGFDLAASYNAVAVLLFHKSHPTEPSETALEYLEHSLRIYSALSGECTSQFATVLSNIGRVYFLRSQFKQALELFERGLAIRQLVLEPTSIDIATALFNVGQTHHRCGNLVEAEHNYRGFLELAQLILGTEHRDVAAGLVLLSDLHRERKDSQSAKALLEQAVQRGRAALGDRHPDLALILNNLGSLSYELRDYDAALAYYVECLQIQKEFLQVQHPHIVISLLNCAQIHKQKGSYNNAFDIYREVYNIHLDACGPDSLEVATTVSSMALMKYLVKDYRVALNFYQEALRLHRERPANDDSKEQQQQRDMDVASSLNSIGLVLFKMDYFDMATDAFLECLNIRKRILGDHRDIAIMWYNLATCFMERGEDSTAMKLYSESLRVERRALGDKHPEISLTLQHLGQMHQERGELEAAVEFFQEALEIERLVLTEKQSNNQSPEETKACICKLLNLIGNIHLMCGRVDEMMQCFVEACNCGRHNGESLIIAGHNFYGLSKMHPPCAPLA